MKPLNFFVFVLITLFISSCNKNQDKASGTGDAIIIAKKSGANTVYGYSFYTYTFDSFKSVKATSSIDPGKNYTLKINQDHKTSFYYETPDADFTTTKPTATVINFSAVFENGATDEFQDELSDKVLDVPSIDKTEYNSTKEELGIFWTSVAGADSYNINILEDSKLVYGSPELANTVKYFAVTSVGNGWITGYKPVAGKSYTIRLRAFLYEPKGNSYNIQAVSLGEKTIVWGK
jgi:hypothetical protein